MGAFLVVSGIILFIVYRFHEDFQEGLRYAERSAAPVKTWLLPVPQAYKDILQKYFLYYQQLSHENKVKFEKKVAQFIYEKKFIPRQIDEVTIEAKVLIAACAVQLTFGLAHIYLRHFRRILVYPNDYYSSITKRYHKGEVNPRFGIIVLSWQSFVEGYVTPTEGRNVGLHEMAHALRLELAIRSEEFPPFEATLLEAFDAFSEKICNEPEFASQAFFRPYACTNPHEFFSVSVENFFERSEQFKEELPALYGILTGLLAQDPIKLKANA